MVSVFYAQARRAARERGLFSHLDVARMKEHHVSGVWCPSLTPVDGEGAPYAGLLVDHCRWLLDEGCRGVVLFGTTGEANSFSIAQRRGALEHVVEGGILPGQLIVGTGCCAVEDTVSLTKHALSLGCARVLVLPPFYYKHVSDDGIVEAYARTIESVGNERLRLYLYRIPQLSGVDITRPVIEALVRRYPNVIAGLKDSSGDWTSMQSICAAFAESLDVLVGSERFLSAALEAGASGCITATANANPQLLRQLYDRPDPDLQQRATVQRDFFETLPVIAALKGFTAVRTRDARWRNLKPPLGALDDEQTSRVREFASKGGLLGV
jgi:4-hydroxy-tetrahydrodipicolinate synthase